MADLTPEQEDTRQVLERWLGDFNLGALGPEVINWIVNGRSAEWIRIEVQRSPVFKQEFPEYDAAIQAGNPMTPAQIMEYRQEVKSMFIDAGLPPGFYDSKDDYVDLISKGLSTPELQTRVERGYARVAGAPQEVKQVFNDYFGVNGESYLATFFLDPDRGARFLTEAVTQAEIGGAGAQYGFGMTQAEAARYQQQGISGEQARQSLQQAYQLQSLTEETISETEDFTRTQLAEGALTGGEQEKRAQRRQQERSAAFGGGPGGAGATRSGLGLGGSS